MKLSFNEEEVLNNIIEDLKSEFKFEQITIVDVKKAENIPKQLKKMLENVTLGSPSVILS